MTRLRRTTGTAIALAACISLALSGCALKMGPSSTPEPTSTNGEIVAVPTASPTVPASEVGTRVTVEEKEYEIGLSTGTFSPGTYTFEIVNLGRVAHNLHITGPGIVDAASDNMASRHSTTLTVTLEAGEYILFCASGEHRTEGMETFITVE
jgi:plastocyanin